MKILVHIFFVFLLLGGLAKAQQQPSNFRKKRIAVTHLDRLDSLSIVPGTFLITGISEKNYLLDAADSRLSWIVLPDTDSVTIQYRVFPFRLNHSNYRYRFDSVANLYKEAPITYRNKKTEAEADARFLDFGAMNYSGSFGRSLSFGNAQDAVVNSLFNLQISGMLADSIQMVAAITDNNIPIQPDGTTQQLNEFDRIWLQFKRRPWEVNIGDIDMRENPSYFLNFYKRQQGIAFETNNNFGKNNKNRLVASGAIAKGKFTRNIFQGQEGNQGPYRLSGANSELYFVILAGTERVFIDGIQMQRGEDQDYTINYNTAEITFMPRQLITKDKRMQVEFEYADRNYLNSLFFVSNQLQINDKWKFNVGLYANSDAKNAPLNQTLDQNQRQFISQIGDSIRLALYPVAVQDTFSASKILYVKKDTVVNGLSYSIYQYKPTYDTALYNLGFTELGAGNGNYIPSYDAANGKVFAWQAPVNGAKQGSFEPVSILITPKRQRIINAGAEYNISEKTLIKTEVAISNYDINTFSDKDKKNDNDVGISLKLEDERDLHVGEKIVTLQTKAAYEYVGEQFKPLERLRTVEFLRDWGLPYDAAVATEQLPSASMRFSTNKSNSFEYALTGYLRSDDYKGIRHTVEYFNNWKGWKTHDIISFTKINGNQMAGHFLRPSVELSKTLDKLKKIEIGGAYSMEHNQMKTPGTDTLLTTAFSFTNRQIFIKSNQEKTNRWSLTWLSRTNKIPAGTKFQQTDNNQNFNAQMELLKDIKHKIRINATYRILKVNESAFTNQQSENTLLARAEYLIHIWNGALSGNTFYEIGAGQEQKRDYSYVEVAAGRGEFTWIDYNADGTPQLNEFETAQFQDQAKYIKIFTPTNQFIKAGYNTFNYSLAFLPAQIWSTKQQTGIKKFISKFSVQSSLQSSLKQISNGRFYVNPFQGTASDTSLISFINSIANTVSFNRYSSNAGLDISNIRNTTKAILAYGFETREVNDYLLKLRKNFGQTITANIVLKKGSNKLITPNPKFDNRNYSVSYYSMEPKFTYTQASVFRTSISYKYDDKQGSTANGGEACFINSISTEAKYNVLQRSVVNAKFTYSKIKYNGPVNTSVAYLMLDALQPGKNMLWNIDFTRRLTNSIEISFQYEGRRAGETKTVHIGRASLRAIL